jgi:Tfp pilus assembly protein PilX
MSKINSQKLNIQNATSQRGAAALPAVFALLILIISVIIILSAMSIAGSQISSLSLKSQKALNYAEAGARDALLRIARDKTYTCAAPSDGCYQIEFTTNGCSTNEGCAKITVSSATSPKVIVSDGYSGTNIRKIQVNITFDASGNGEILSTAWSEITN